MPKGNRDLSKPQEIRTKGIPPEKYTGLENAAKYYGMSLSSLTRPAIIKLYDELPEHVKKRQE